MFVLTIYTLLDDGLDVSFQAASMSEQKLQIAALRWAEDAGIWDADETQDDATAFAQLARLFDSSEEPDNPRLLIRKADSLDDQGR